MSNLLKDYSCLLKLLIYLIIILIPLFYILLTIEIRDNYAATIIKDDDKYFIISKKELNGNLFLLKGEYYYFKIISFNKTKDSNDILYEYEVTSNVEVKSYLNFENISIMARKKLYY